MPNLRPTQSVIIPATNRPASLDRCLEAVAASTHPPDEVIVVDAPASAGPAEARNIGVSRASGDVVVFVDADVAVHADALARIRSAFASDPELDAVFGSYDDRPPVASAVSRFRNLLHHHVHTSSPGEAETFWAGLGAVSRESFEDVGGFDSARFGVPSIEDVELGLRLRRRGASIVLDPEIRGTHLKGWSLSEMVRTDLTRRGIPWVRLELESGTVSTSLNLAWRNRVSALAALAATAAALARRPVGAAGALAAMVALNHAFFGLLRRRGGIGLAAAGVPLLAVHYLVASLAAFVATISHLLDRAR